MPATSESLAGTKYLYLAAQAYANTWVNGGEIPIKLASTYLSEKREGTLTPDEGRIRNGPADLAVFGESVVITGKNGWLQDNVFDDTVVPNGAYNDFADDGLILSFSNVLAPAIRDRLDKVVCVAIDDFSKLKKALDDLIGQTSIARNCEYTNGFQRHHFLKSAADAWMSEYRLFWHGTEENAKVVLPAGLARHIEVR